MTMKDWVAVVHGRYHGERLWEKKVLQPWIIYIRDMVRRDPLRAGCIEKVVLKVYRKIFQSLIIFWAVMLLIQDDVLTYNEYTVCIILLMTHHIQQLNTMESKSMNA